MLDWLHYMRGRGPAPVNFLHSLHSMSDNGAQDFDCLMGHMCNGLVSNGVGSIQLEALDGIGDRVVSVRLEQTRPLRWQLGPIMAKVVGQEEISLPYEDDLECSDRQGQVGEQVIMLDEVVEGSNFALCHSGCKTEGISQSSDELEAQLSGSSESKAGCQGQGQELALALVDSWQG
ncbi:hypothetical protein OG21DRAFT_1524745 [Imleria badia]|nr:hypothetical protein OG21DRAFT_1524745 [Imleria badia]